MTVNYPFKKIEKKWQLYWDDHKSFATASTACHPCESRDPWIPGQARNDKVYVLEMLPYPSGKIHMGHVRNYAIGDAIARYLKLKGKKILHPMGWDAFGLPAENAAIENKSHPKTWTYQNIKEMKAQLLKLGFSYDWDREIATCDPDYYKHEQKFFIELFEKGLVYRADTYVNWDPVENTVLANEQVVDGRGWRSGALVERKKLSQWNVKITAYADELLSDLKTLEGMWPEKVLKMQENWIGKSEGAVIRFGVTKEGHEPLVIPAQAGIQSKDPRFRDEDSSIEVYTTCPETIFGLSFMAIAYNHPFVANLDSPEIDAFIEECAHTANTEEAMATVEKKGVFTGYFVENPFDFNIKAPIYITNYVIADYGTGAVFGCPAHDERDFEFAKKYDLPIKEVIQPLATTDGLNEKLPYTKLEGTMVNSGFLDGLSRLDAREKIKEVLEKEAKGKRKTQYRLRDWGVSRQRYWGCPIPMVHCNNCGIVPETNLPVTLPEDVDLTKPGNPLANHPTWKNTKCPKCGDYAYRETDTLDTFFESSWYFLRYISPHSDKPFEKEEANYWMPVDYYIGGIEHAVMHLLYARFFTKALRDLGYLDIAEPFKRLITQGMVCHATYQNKDGQWIYPSEVIKTPGGLVDRNNNAVIEGPALKMSKSKKNVVDPSDSVEAYGADAVRLFILSDSPIDKDFDWNDDGLEGCWRYINKLWNLCKTLYQFQGKSNRDDQLERTLHSYIKLIGSDFENFAFNKAIAHHRELTKKISEMYSYYDRDIALKGIEVLAQTLTPIAPHLSSEIWAIIHDKNELDVWPKFDEKLAESDNITIAIQVNGKKRGLIEMPKDASEKELLETAEKEVAKYLENMMILKRIVVPGRMISFVVKE